MMLGLLDFAGWWGIDSNLAGDGLEEVVVELGHSKKIITQIGFGVIDAFAAISRISWGMA